MADTGNGTILLRNTMAFDRERANEFKRAIVDAVAFAKAHAPQLMVQVYIDDAKALCTSFQLYDSSDAILRHWQVSDPYIADVMKYCVVQSMEVFGSPSQAVRDGIVGALGAAKVRFTPELVGFHRMAEA